MTRRVVGSFSYQKRIVDRAKIKSSVSLGNGFSYLREDVMADAPTAPVKEPRKKKKVTTGQQTERAPAAQAKPAVSGSGNSGESTLYRIARLVCFLGPYVIALCLILYQIFFSSKAPVSH
jgi:hypothetical protein